MSNKNEYLISGSGVGKIPAHTIEKLNEKLEEYYDIPQESTSNLGERLRMKFKESPPIKIVELNGFTSFNERSFDKRQFEKDINKRRKRNKNRKTHRK